MGRMKEVFMEMIQKQYDGDYDKFLEQNAKQWVAQEIQCPNCGNEHLLQNEDDYLCEGCAQEFIKVEGALRFR